MESKIKAEIILNLKEDSTRKENIERLASLFNARLKEAQKELLENWSKEITNKLKDAEWENDKIFYRLLFGQIRKKLKGES